MRGRSYRITKDFARGSANFAMASETENQPLCDQIGREKFDAVIEQFYRKLLADAVLGKYFQAIPHFAAHQRRFAEFWWIGLGGSSDDPPAVDMAGKHENLGLGVNEFNRWAGLFAETAHELLDAEHAEAWIRLTHGTIRRLRAIQ